MTTITTDLALCTSCLSRPADGRMRSGMPIPICQTCKDAQDAALVSTARLVGQLCGCHQPTSRGTARLAEALAPDIGPELCSCGCDAPLATLGPGGDFTHTIDANEKHRALLGMPLAPVDRTDDDFKAAYFRTLDELQKLQDASPLGEWFDPRNHTPQPGVEYDDGTLEDGQTYALVIRRDGGNRRVVLSTWHLDSGECGAFNNESDQVIPMKEIAWAARFVMPPWPDQDRPR